MSATRTPSPLGLIGLKEEAEQGKARLARLRAEILKLDLPAEKTSARDRTACTTRIGSAAP
jgi:hypothetical protein